MKAVCYMKPGVAVQNLDEQPMFETGVKIKVAYSSICGSDMHVIGGAFDSWLPSGLVMGHESSGTVIELGEAANKKGLKVGDKVVFYFKKYCGSCYYCRSGKEWFCPTAEMTQGVYGAAEIAVVDEQAVYKIPDDMPLEQACLAEPITVSLRAIDNANIKPGNSVLISGGGGVGLLTMLLAKHNGATKLTVSEPIAEKRKLALELGADYVIDPMNEDMLERVNEITDGFGFDSVLECSGAPRALDTSFKALGKGGTLVLVALYGDYQFPVSTEDIFQKEATIRGAYQSPFVFPRAIELMRHMDLKPFTQCIIPMDDCEKAYETQKTGKYPKVIMKIG